MTGVTEEEARKTWCPMSRIDNFHSKPAFNRYDDGSISERSLCIASGCRMWDWMETKELGAESNPEGGLDETVKRTLPRHQWKGDCGLKNSTIHLRG